MIRSALPAAKESCMSPSLLVKRLAIVFAAGFAVLASSPGAHASLVTYYYSGTFQSVQFGAPAALIGTTFSGSFSYDPAALATTIGGNFLSYASGTTMSVQTVLGAGQTGAGAGNMRSTWDALIATSLAGVFNPADEFSVGGAASFDPGLAVFNNGMSLQFVDGLGGPADDPFGSPFSAPPGTLPLSDIDAAEIHLSGAGLVGGVLRLTALADGVVSCLSLRPQDCGVPVPEPASPRLALTALAAAALAARQARWPRRAKKGLTATAVARRHL
jgi:hypothetical protein